MINRLYDIKLYNDYSYRNIRMIELRSLQVDPDLTDENIILLLSTDII